MNQRAISIVTVFCLCVAGCLVPASTDDTPTPDASVSSLVELAPAGQPWEIALDDNNVYWTDEVSGGVMMISKDGDMAPKLVGTSGLYMTGHSASEGLFLDGGVLFWSEWDHRDGLGDVVKTALAGGTTVTLFTLEESTAIAVSDGVVFVLGYQSLMAGDIAGNWSRTLSGTGGADGLAVNNGTVYWTPYAMNNDVVLSVPVDGGMTSTFSTGTGGMGDVSCALVIDGSNMFWGEIDSGGSGGTVFQQSLSGGAPMVLLQGDFFPSALAVNDGFVYIAGGRIGEEVILKVPVGGGTVTTLASGESWPDSIAVDDTSVYWGNTAPDAGAIMKLTPK